MAKEKAIIAYRAGSDCVNEESFFRRNLLLQKKVSENPSLPTWHQTFVEDTYVGPNFPNLRRPSILTPPPPIDVPNPTTFRTTHPSASSDPRPLLSTRFSRTQPIVPYTSICLLGPNSCNILPTQRLTHSHPHFPPHLCCALLTNLRLASINTHPRATNHRFHLLG
ncbi:hypothetical protein ACSQ67_009026 [Phaseolus vulgaris]